MDTINKPSQGEKSRAPQAVGKPPSENVVSTQIPRKKYKNKKGKKKKVGEFIRGRKLKSRGLRQGLSQVLF